MLFIELDKESRTKIARGAYEMGNKADTARLWGITPYLVTRCMKEYDDDRRAALKTAAEEHVVTEGELRRQVNIDKAVARVYSNKATSARDSGKPFLVRFEFVRELFKNPICPYSGVKMGGEATFERVDPTVGYTESNTILVHKDANACKSILDAFLHDPRLTMPQKKAVLERVLATVKWE